MDLAPMLGLATGLFGITAFAHQVFQKREEVQALEAEKEDLVAERDALAQAKVDIEQEKKELQLAKDAIEDRVQRVRGSISEIQKAVANGNVQRDRMAEILDDLERAVLPKDDQVLSKLDRLQQQVSRVAEHQDDDGPGGSGLG